MRLVLCLGVGAASIAAGRLSPLMAAEAPAASRWVELSGDVDKDLEQLLSELLGRSGLSVTWSAPSSEGRVIARVHVQLSDDGALLDVVDPRGVSPERQVSVLRHGTPVLFRETLAHVILGNVDPLAAMDAENTRATPAASETAAPLPAAPVAAPPVVKMPPPRVQEAAQTPVKITEKQPADERLRFTFGVGGGALVVARDRAAPVIGGSLGLVFPGALQPRAAVSAGYMPPIGVDAEGLAANFRLIPLRARVGLEPWTSRWLAVDAALSFGADWLTFSPTETSAELHAAPSSTRFTPMVGALLGARAHLSAGLDATLGLGLDFDATPRTWLVVEGPRSTAVLETLRFRPSAALGLEWTFPSERAVSPRTLGSL